MLSAGAPGSSPAPTVWQPPGEPTPRVVIQSLDDFLAHTAEGPDSQPIFEERLLESEVRARGGLAQVWARYEARLGAPGAVARRALSAAAGGAPAHTTCGSTNGSRKLPAR